MKVPAGRFARPRAVRGVRRFSRTIACAAAIFGFAPVIAAVPVTPPPVSEPLSTRIPAGIPTDAPFVPADDALYPSTATLAPGVDAASNTWSIGFIQIALLGAVLLALVTYLRRRQRRRVGWGVLPDRQPVPRDPRETRP